MPDTDQNIALLRQLVEESAGHRLKTSTDFSLLSDEIQNRLGQTLGVSTLKRIWGYIGGYATTRVGTLNILARFAGFPDWATFVADYCGQEAMQSSHRVVTDVLPTEGMAEGAVVEVCWNPDRRCLFRHLGGGNFVVVESHNAKVRAGDTFQCAGFTLSEPLYVTHLVHDGQTSDLFVMGKKGGLTSVKVV